MLVLLVLPLVAQECDLEEMMDMGLLEKTGGLGSVGSIIPEEYGRPGLSFSENSLIVEEFRRNFGTGRAAVRS